MKVYNVIPRGFCKGVIQAIETALKTKTENPECKIYLLGLIVHNRHINQALNKLGIMTLVSDHLSKLELLDTINEGIIILSAHGTSQQIYDKIIQKNLRYIDTTCQYVKNSFSTIQQILDKKGEIIYIGKKNHPEAEAAISISEDKIHLISTESDLELLNLKSNLVYVTNQTTMSKIDIADLYNRIISKYPQAILLDEQCNATFLRQNAILNLDKSIDLIFIVGDKLSNNSQKLYELSNKLCESHLIDSIEDIKIDWLKDKNYVAVTSGASTPRYLTQHIVKWLNDFDYHHITTHQKPALESEQILNEFKIQKE